MVKALLPGLKQQLTPPKRKPQSSESEQDLGAGKNKSKKQKVARFERPPADKMADKGKGPAAKGFCRNWQKGQEWCKPSGGQACKFHHGCNYIQDGKPCGSADHGAWEHFSEM